MRSSRVALLAVVFLMAGTPCTAQDGWRGITPTRATKSDVLQILGEPDRTEAGSLEYSFANEIVRFELFEGAVAPSDCERELPVGTVVEIRVETLNRPSVKSMTRRMPGLERLADDGSEDPEDVVYFDNGAGVLVAASDGRVESVIYMAPAAGRDECAELRLQRTLEDARDEVATGGVISCVGPVCTAVTADRTEVSAGDAISVTAQATDPSGETLVYTWAATDGRIVGSGPTVTWDTTGLALGRYTITAQVDNGQGHVVDCSLTLMVTP